MAKLFLEGWSGQQDLNLHQVLEIINGDSEKVLQGGVAAGQRRGGDSDFGRAR